MRSSLIKLQNYCQQHFNGIDTRWVAKVIEEAEREFDEHVEHVSRFLQEMYATMIDPVDQPKMKVAEMCEALLNAAREQREIIASAYAVGKPAPAYERAEFEKAREDAVQAYMDRGTIMRLGEESLLRARADFRAGWHAAWQARAALSADPSRDQRMWEQVREKLISAREDHRKSPAVNSWYCSNFNCQVCATFEFAIRALTYPGAETTDNARTALTDNAKK